MRFLIQTYNGQIKHDFSFTLLQSIEYQNWLTNSNDFEYALSDQEMPENHTPIGSVEFVVNYLRAHYKLEPKPKNIPEELLGFEFTKRKVFNGTNKDIIKESFVKSNDKIKSFTEICSSAPKGNYQISEIIDIESEWRGFVYNRKLVGLQNYSGAFDVFPDVDLIKTMINNYNSQPIAYTLDVGVNKINGTFIIEVHDFFSCGLYGFSDHSKLPFMFSRWFYEYIRNKQ